MKKKILALLLGGVLAVGGFIIQPPAMAQAVRLMPECVDSISDPHIKSNQVATVDGQLTVTIDLEFEQTNAYFNLYVFDTQLEKVDRGCGSHKSVINQKNLLLHFPLYPVFHPQ